MATQNINTIPNDQLLKAVEVQFSKVYKQCLEELEQKGIINEEIKNQAESQSNIDAMASQVSEQASDETE